MAGFEKSVPEIDATLVRDRVFDISAVQVTISALLIYGGSESVGGGGGIRNRGGTVSLNYIRCESNSASDGGGILNDENGNITIESSIIRRNIADMGGGINNREGGLNLMKSVVEYNISRHFGAGLFNSIVGQTVVRMSHINDNDCIYKGGGIDNAGNMELYKSTVFNNEAGEGGGISNSGTLELQNCTLDGNLASDEIVVYLFDPLIAPGGVEGVFKTIGSRNGGGILNFDEGFIMLKHVTLAYNAVGKGEGLNIWNSGEIEFENTLIASDPSSEGVNCFNTGLSTLESWGGNMESPGDTCSLDKDTDQINIEDPGLDSRLRYNGGSTWNLALLMAPSGAWKSPAIDTADSEWCLYDDQRDNDRPDGNGCDIGAYETGSVVTITEDSPSGGEVSLRGAIKASNDSPGRDAIIIPPGIYMLALAGCCEDGAETGDLDITDDLFIEGAGPGVTVIDGSGLDRVFDVDPERGGISVYMEGLTIMGGNGFSDGGGIRNQGVLELVNVEILDNVSAFFGGGIDNQEDLTLVNCTVSGNQAGGGGGIRNSGAAILEATTVSGNRVEYETGGGVSNSGELSMRNSTVSGNTAAFDGGGIFNEVGTIELVSMTLSGNSSEFKGVGGIYVLNDMVSLTNTLIEGDCGGPGFVVTGGGNLESPGDTCGLADATDQAGVSAEDLDLGPLADNGGPTETHALGPGSLARDAAIKESCFETDQRRLLHMDGSCDVGSFEIGALPDGDDDGVADEMDNCPDERNPYQGDVDGDGIGNGCDGCTDVDGDGYGFTSREDCTFSEDDCDDGDPDVNPGASEAHGNGIDDDCDGLIDEPLYVDELYFGDLGPFGDGDGRWSAADFSLSIGCIYTALEVTSDEVDLLDVAPVQICEGPGVTIWAAPNPDGRIDESDLSVLLQASSGYVVLVPYCP